MRYTITLPATRIALTAFDPIFVDLGRAIIASLLSLILLVTTKQPFPHWRFLPSLAIAISGAVVGFPLLSTLAMRDTSASYGAVIIGLLPLATAFLSCGVLEKDPLLIFGYLRSLVVAWLSRLH